LLLEIKPGEEYGLQKYDLAEDWKLLWRAAKQIYISEKKN